MECNYNKQHILTISQSNELVRVQLERIVYLISDGNYTTMVLTDGREHLFSFNLSKFMELVDQVSGDQASLFIRVGKRLIVNQSFIFCIQPSKQKLLLWGEKLSTTFVLAASKDSLRRLKSELELKTEPLMK